MGEEIGVTSRYVETEQAHTIVDVTVINMEFVHGNRSRFFGWEDRFSVQVEYGGRIGHVVITEDEIKRRFLWDGLKIERGSVISVRFYHIVWEGDPPDT